jgi:hypothetical protein
VLHDRIPSIDVPPIRRKVFLETTCRKPAVIQVIYVCRRTNDDACGVYFSLRALGVPDGEALIRRRLSIPLVPRDDVFFPDANVFWKRWRQVGG